ncbi:hypothetical protein V8E36_003613 [Tilletia maclaganii]
MIWLTKCPELQNEACAKLQDRKSSSFQSQLPTPTIARSRDKSTASSSSAVSNQHLSDLARTGFSRPQILNLHVYRADIDHYGERGQIIGFSFLHDHDLNGDVLALTASPHTSSARRQSISPNIANASASKPVTLLPRFPAGAHSARWEHAPAVNCSHDCFNARGTAGSVYEAGMLLDHRHLQPGTRAALLSHDKTLKLYRMNARKTNDPNLIYKFAVFMIDAAKSMAAGDAEDGVLWAVLRKSSSRPEFPHALHELALLHERGIDNVLFVDPKFSCELLALAAELGYAPSAYKLGVNYEYGRMGRPQDAGLSIHANNIAAQQGHKEACFALTAWYLVGAPSVLPQSDAEAYIFGRRRLRSRDWARRTLLLQMGIGTVKDPAESRAWYKRANQRLAAMGSSNGIGLGFGRRLVERLQLTLENLDGTGSIFHVGACLHLDPGRSLVARILHFGECLARLAQFGAQGGSFAFPGPDALHAHFDPPLADRDKA